MTHNKMLEVMDNTIANLQQQLNDAERMKRFVAKGSYENIDTDTILSVASECGLNIIMADVVFVKLYIGEYLFCADEQEPLTSVIEDMLDERIAERNNEPRAIKMRRDGNGVTDLNPTPTGVQRTTNDDTLTDEQTDTLLDSLIEGNFRIGFPPESE